MEIKYTIQGLLIYTTIAVYLAALIAAVAGRAKAGRWLFVAGFLAATIAFVYRWLDVRHVPLQNLFEVFLFLGMICYPISWFCRRLLRIGGQWADMLIGAIVLFPAGFVFNAEPMHLPPALQSWLFAPHVAVYMLAYIFMAKAAFQAGEQLIGERPAIEQTWIPPEQATYELVTLGFPLLTLGLLLGSWWGKLAWGHYWGWDPKELWSLASWLVYVGYFHWRYMYGRKRPRINSLWALTGMAAIIITLLWVNLSRLFAGLHSYAT
jgi:ABC-type transport system involved in cytochrome c biogenesis permease subunit